MNHRTVLSSFAALLTTAVAVAQTPVSLVGLTRFTSTLAQTLHAPCATLPGCPAAGLPPVAGVGFAAGGTAYDGTNNTVWATNGLMLASYAGPASACAVVCPPMPCPKSSAVAQATGLDVAESLNELWVVDDQNWLTRCALGCPPTITAQCLVATLPGDRITGVAVDDGNGVVFYTAVSAVGSTLYAAQIGSPCSPFANAPLADCSAAAVPAYGVAADWGAARLYWTDGPSTYAFSYAYNPSGPSIAYGPQTCCPFVQSPNDPYTDLTLRPRGTSPAGNPCANGSCPTCLNYHGLRNAPILGNTVELGLDDAPEASFAWCLLSIGSCTTGMPTLPPLCGPLLVGPGPTLGFNITSGTSGCLGSTTFFLPLPAAPAFAGLPLASQCVLLCGGGTGTALSNCQSWVLMGV
ncbi:MAG: hypothetical protein KDE27_15090 [Planctomycetes bacterium]|nr:hypothetical protein [Planctomycetota bacterium]